MTVLQSFFGLNFGQNADIDIILDNQDERKMGEIKDENGRKERLPLFYDGESVTGKVRIFLILQNYRIKGIHCNCDSLKQDILPLQKEMSIQ